MMKADLQYRAIIEALRATDLDFYELYDRPNSRLVVVPELAGRVLGSTSGGARSPCHGWVDLDLVRDRRPGAFWCDYGGDDCYWLGPRRGAASVWSDLGPPDCVDTGAFAVNAEQTDRRRVAMTMETTVVNASGTTLMLQVKRTVSLLSREDAESALAVEIPDTLAVIGFSSANTIVNTGTEEWTAVGGAPCSWIMGQYQPDVKILMPIRHRDLRTVQAQFCPRTPNSHLLKKAPGVVLKAGPGYSGRVGVNQDGALNVLGSWNRRTGVLTVVWFSLPEDADTQPYFNMNGDDDEPAFGGDVVLACNDGRRGYCEIGTIAPAAFLGPGEEQDHIHRTFHFTGEEAALRNLCREVLGFDLAKL